MDNLTPTQIVDELDQYIIGQAAAKRAVAVAIRNRWRRQQLDPAVAKEINPKNIVMVGPTGVGKTEIARRIATLTGAPFVKVEATKFTEVGYHGRDVESMIRDLVENAISIVTEEQSKKVRTKAEEAAEQRLLDLLLPDSGPSPTGSYVEPSEAAERKEQTRAKLLEKLRAGELDEREVEITTNQKAAPVTMLSNMGLDQMDPSMTKMFENLIPEQTSRNRLPISKARRVLIDQETELLIDQDKLNEEAITRAEQSGIVFLDEIDKIATPTDGGKGSPDVSRQGVQRDLLPIVEGSAVSTRYGPVNTDHILFIAAGAFHSASVSDLMPELQGRFPIRVELEALTKEDFVRILTEPSNSLTSQQQALLGSEGLTVEFADDAIDEMAQVAATVNARTENIGARRLVTITEKLFEEINFNAPQIAASGDTTLKIDRALVTQQLATIAQDEDLSRFVL